MPTAKQKGPTMSDLLAKVQELSNELEALKQKQQPVVAQKSTKGGPRPDVFYVLAGIPSKGLPPQAIVCARVLSTARDVNHISEEEAMELIERAKVEGRLRTKQGAWHIFQYYRPRLIEGDFLRMITEA